MQTKIIAEACYNHNGSIEKAKELIDEAKKLKLWAVKFQKWDIENFPNYVKNKKRLDIHAYGKTQYEHRKALEFSIEQLQELKKYTEKKGMEFICSGKDFVSIKQLVEMGCKWIKLPSQRYKDNDIFKYLYRERAKRGFYIIVSTGMYYEKEIPKSRWVQEADILMHCISLYPAKVEDCNIGFMRRMGFYNGYSSHEKEGEVIKYAVAIGARFIERHFTLDKTDKGSDHSISSDIKEMKRIIKDIKDVEKILGDGRRVLTGQEIKHREYYRSF